MLGVVEFGAVQEVVDGGLGAWDGAACGLFVTNLGLPKYESTFAFNLSGKALASLSMSGLAQMGVAPLPPTLTSCG